MSLTSKVIAALVLAGLMAAALFAAYTRGHINGVNAERVVNQEKEIARKAAEAAAQEQRREENRMAEAAQSLRVAQLEKANEKVNAALRARSADLDAIDAAAGGLRVTRAVCDGLGMPEASASAGSNDARLAGTVQLPAEVERFLRAEADRADEIVEQARIAQRWVEGERLYPTIVTPK